MSFVATLKARASQLKRHTLVVYYAARDPGTPWPVRLLALLVAAYALSPIDLIPDFIPVLGYLDDLILVPLGLAWVIRLLPAEVLAAATEQAGRATERPSSRVAAGMIVIAWLAALLLLGIWLRGLFRH